MGAIDSFSGEYRWLSNFWPVDIIHNGFIFPSVENAYQASKVNPDNTKIINFMTKCSPSVSKRLGRNNSIYSNEQWCEIKLDIMCKLLIQKFETPYLKDKLIQTKNMELIEGNHWGDKYWGMCKINGTFVGLNNLGKLIMKIRDDYL